MKMFVDASFIDHQSPLGLILEDGCGVAAVSGSVFHKIFIARAGENRFLEQVLTYDDKRGDYYLTLRYVGKDGSVISVVPHRAWETYNEPEKFGDAQKRYVLKAGQSANWTHDGLWYTLTAEKE